MSSCGSAFCNITVKEAEFEVKKRKEIGLKKNVQNPFVQMYR
jgi:hypothetical protein